MVNIIFNILSYLNCRIRSMEKKGLNQRNDCNIMYQSSCENFRGQIILQKVVYTHERIQRQNSSPPAA